MWTGAGGGFIIIFFFDEILFCSCYITHSKSWNPGTHLGWVRREGEEGQALQKFHVASEPPGTGGCIAEKNSELLWSRGWARQRANSGIVPCQARAGPWESGLASGCWGVWLLVGAVHIC